MRPWVKKYGGTSVGSLDRIQRVAKCLAEESRAGKPLIVVVSAMGDTTDDLLKMAHDLSSAPPHREMDMLLTAGERISMALLSIALKEEGIEAVSYTGSQVGILTTEAHRNATILGISGERVEASLAAGRVVIVAGFQGVSLSKEITTLGRGGSDTTAVALAARFGAERCEIWTDVDGVYSARPHQMASAQLRRSISYEGMLAMAQAGARVLHPRCVALAQKYGVSLWVRSSLNSSDLMGTEIGPRDRAIENYPVLAVAEDLEHSVVTVALARPSAASGLLEKARQAGLQLKDAAQFGEHFRFLIESGFLGSWNRLLDQCVLEGFLKSYRYWDGFVPLSLIRSSSTEYALDADLILTELAKVDVFPEMFWQTGLATTFLVPESKSQEALQSLHQRWVVGTK